MHCDVLHLDWHFLLFAQIAVTRLSFSVHGEILVSALIRNVMVLPTAMILQTKESAVSYGASVISIHVCSISI